MKNFIVGLALLSISAFAADFTNPVHEHGPDPWVVVYKGNFYYICTTATNLTIWKSPTLEGLKQSPGTRVWAPTGTYQQLTDLWAPELHRIDSKWYIYFAADTGKDNSKHRIYVVENKSPDPIEGKWEMKGQVSDSSQDWAIDATVFESRGKLYMVWSGWPGGADGIQNIYIAHLKNPWTVEGGRVMLSTPQLDWEKFDDGHHVYVNEGPEVLEHADKLLLTYSASGCWTDHYAVGMLTASKNSDPMNPTSWHKSSVAVLSGSESAHTISTGHNGFFKSPDGKQDWIIYHANVEEHQGCGDHRSSRAQQFTWKPDGSPNFGAPIPIDQALPEPSGEQVH